MNWWGHEFDGGKCQKCGAWEGTDAAISICPKAEFIHVTVHQRESNAIIDSFNNTSSGKKIRKKVGKLYNTQLHRIAILRIDEYTKNKPRWMPKFIWTGIVKMVTKDL